MLETIPTISLAYVAILTGFVGLIWSADKFVLGSASIARNFGLSPLLVGLTIVSLGTSAPEVVVSISASQKGAGDLAIGNAIGSNIANIGLVLAVTMLVAKIPVQTHILRDEMPVLLFVTAIAGLFLFDAELVNWEGWALLLLIFPVIWYLIRCKKKDLTSSEIAEESDFEPIPTKSAIIWFVIGLALLILASEILVWGAKTTAIHYGVSPLIIGLTVIAIGTSLPELAASVASALKGHHDIALGNIVGSNIFNLLAVMSIPGIIHPPILESSIFFRDYLVMLGLTFILVAAILISLNGKGETKTLGPIIGSVLLLCYIGYYILLFTTQ